MATRGLGLAFGEHAGFAEKYNSRVTNAARFASGQTGFAALKKGLAFANKKQWF